MEGKEDQHTWRDFKSTENLEDREFKNCIIKMELLSQQLSYFEDEVESTNTDIF